MSGTGAASGKGLIFSISLLARRGLLPLLGVVLFAGVAYALPPQQDQTAIPSNAGSTLATNSAQPTTDVDLQQPPLQRGNRRYQLSDGDVLELEFSFTPEFNQTVTVQPDGYISLSGVGTLHAEGETVTELKQSLQRAYTKILRDPVITVALKDFVKPYFIVGGQVQRPGKFDLRGNTTVLQAIEIAGGFNDSAKHSQVLLFRPVSQGQVEVKRLNLKSILRGKDLSADINLEPGDMLFVSKSMTATIRKFIPSPSMGAFYNP